MSSRPQHYHTRYRDVLTPRQREVLALMADGLTNPQIAERFGISLDGAKWHVSEILAKLDVASREEAIALWEEQSRPSHRLREMLAAIGGARLLLRVGVGAAIVSVTALVVVGVWLAGRDDSPPLTGDETPSPTPGVLACPVATGVCETSLLFANVLNRGDAGDVIASIAAITVKCPPAGEEWLPYEEACTGRADRDVTGYRYFGAKQAVFYAVAGQFREPVERLLVADDGSRVTYHVVAVACPGDRPEAPDCSRYAAATLAGTDRAGDIVRIVTIPLQQDPGSALRAVGIDIVPVMDDPRAQGGRGTTSFPLVSYPAEMLFVRWDAAAQPIDGPCDPASLVEGFLVLGADDPEPGCLGSRQPIPPDARRYEIAVPPGPYNQVAIDDPDWDGWQYVRDDTGDVAFAIYRSRWTGLAGRVVRAANPQAVASMPGPALRADDGGIQRVWWQEGDLTFRLEVSPGATGLDLDRAAALLTYFTGASAAYWDPAAGDFRVENRPAWLYDETATTGVPVIDATLAAYFKGESLSPFVGSIAAPCVVDPPPGPIVAPACPPGAAAGDPMQAHLIVRCAPDWTGVSLSVDMGFDSPRRLNGFYGVGEVVDPQYPDLRYAAILGDEKLLTLLFSETVLVGIGGSCATPELVPWARTVDSWLLPPLYPLPPEAP